MFEKVQTKKVYMEIVEQIQKLIKEGKLKPGDKLPPERILAKKLGVSRPPLREALSALEILGIIECRGGRGNIIKNSFDPDVLKQRFKELESEQSPFELLEARKVVEMQIAGLAAKKALKEDIVAIEESLRKMKDSLSNITKILEYDREFHVNVARAAHNSVLFSMMNYLADGLKEKLWVNLKEKCYNLPGRPEKYLREHIEIFNAIKNKDSKGASRKMYTHLAGVEKDLLG